MRILLWSHNAELDARISPVLSAAGHVLFRETEIGSLLSATRREDPFLIVIAPVVTDEAVLAAVFALANHPDTRWTPVLLLAEAEADRGFLRTLLEAGAAALITLDQDTDLLHARLTALERSGLQVASLRSARFTDEGTGFYHQTFLLDQLQVFCRKQMRDDVGFCMLFLELRGHEDEIRKYALQLAATVRGADLFGRWEDSLFAVLLPASGEEQAQLLCSRFERILEPAALESRCALVVSSHATVETEALIEAALNTLDAAWGPADGPFLWVWHETDSSATPFPQKV